MKFILTRHASEQMQEQEDDVTAEQIETVLDTFHRRVPENGTIRYVGFIGVAKELNVVTEFPGVAIEPVKIVTVYWE